MGKRHHTPALILAGALTLALLGGSTLAGLATDDEAGAAGATPALKPVPKVVKVKSAKKPPKTVKFNGKPVPGGVTTGTGTATGGAGEVIIPGVPAYKWRDGCGPTAVGMVIGYYDNQQGWDDLVAGEVPDDSPEAQQMVASRGSSTSPAHYEDFALPMDASTATILADRSAAPAGDEHVSDSVADFMHASWSADGLRYGWSWSSMAGPAFTGYVKAKYPSSAPTTSTYAGTSLTWDKVMQEMSAGRPMVFLVDSDGDARTDHFVTIVGYRESNGYPEYACWDTWSTTTLRWERFRAMSTSYGWGVWGGFTYSIDATLPAPEPTPTPTPPVIEEPPAPTPSDTLAPVTVQTGADDLWHNTAVTVAFSATDDVSGVAYTEYSLDGGAWTKGTSVTIAPPKKTAVAAIHTVEYRSVDVAGNVESSSTAFVKIDTKKPVTTSNATSTAYAGSFTLKLTALDPDAGVKATYVSIDGGAYQQATTATITGAGRHTIRFYSIDNAKNTETAKSVTVRIK